jgi:hypothetical protein
VTDEMSPERAAIVRAEQRRLSERRRAAGLLDRLLNDLYGPDAVDYTGQLLHHNRHYGVPACSELPSCRDGRHSPSCEVSLSGPGDRCPGDAAHPPHPAGAVRGCWACDPCAYGRCSDPAAHAEGGHDL